MRFIITLALLALSLQAQTSRVSHYFKDGSNRIQYVCASNPVQTPYVWSRGLFQITSVVDSGTTSTITFPNDHGLYVGAVLQITGADQSALNNSFQVVTVTSSKIVTITTSGVTDGTYTEQTMKITTSWPRLNARVWDLMVYLYSGVDTDPAASHPALGAVACTDRTLYY